MLVLYIAVMLAGSGWDVSVMETFLFVWPDNSRQMLALGLALCTVYVALLKFTEMAV